MKLKNKIIFLLCFSLYGTVHAESFDYSLDTVYVNALRNETSQTVPGDFTYYDSQNGILGKQDILSIPFTKVHYTPKTIHIFSGPGQPLSTLLVNDPSIRASTSSPMYTDFSMRGINMNGNHIYLNRIPNLFYQFTTPPQNIIGSVDIGSGPIATLNGAVTSSNGTNSGKSASPGVIDITTKKAGKEPLTRYTQTFSGRSFLGESIDVSRRLGTDQKWGLRINAENLNGTLSLPGTKVKEKNIFFNLDHQDSKSTTNLFGGYFDLRIDGGQRWFQFSPTNSWKGKNLPSAPHSKISYDYPETTKYVHSYLFTLNHTQEISSHWKWFMNTGYSERGGMKYNSGSALYFNESGDFTSKNAVNNQNESSRNWYAQLGLSGIYQTGPVMHQISISFDRAWTKYWNSSKTASGQAGYISGNLYDGISFNPSIYPLPSAGGPAWSNEELVFGTTAADMMTYKKWDFLAAATHRNGKFRSSSEQVNNKNTLPSFGIIYHANENMSFYTGHSESYSRGVYVSDSKYVNYGHILDPVRNKQTETGFKYRTEKRLYTVSYFDMNQGNYVDSQHTDGLYYTLDGKSHYQGVEGNITGKLSDQLNIMGGFMYLHANQENTAGGINDGKRVSGVSSWSTVLSLEYALKPETSLIGRMIYNGESYIQNEKVRIPGYTTFDLGITHETSISGIPVKLRLMCYNLTNKSYWMARGGSDTFGLSVPRTFELSAQFDL